MKLALLQVIQIWILVLLLYIIDGVNCDWNDTKTTDTFPGPWGQLVRDTYKKALGEKIKLPKKFIATIENDQSPPTDVVTVTPVNDQPESINADQSMIQCSDGIFCQTENNNNNDDQNSNENSQISQSIANPNSNPNPQMLLTTPSVQDMTTPSPFKYPNNIIYPSQNPIRVRPPLNFVNFATNRPPFFHINPFRYYVPPQFITRGPFTQMPFLFPPRFYPPRFQFIYPPTFNPFPLIPSASVQHQRRFNEDLIATPKNQSITNQTGSSNVTILNQ